MQRSGTRNPWEGFEYPLWSFKPRSLMKSQEISPEKDQQKSQNQGDQSKNWKGKLHACTRRHKQNIAVTSFTTGNIDGSENRNLITLVLAKVLKTIIIVRFSIHIPISMMTRGCWDQTLFQTCKTDPFATETSLGNVTSRLSTNLLPNASCCC